MLTSRELASLVWALLLVVLFLLIPKWRRAIAPSMKDVIQALFKWKLIRIFGVFLLWTALWIWLAWQAGLWEHDLLKDTVIIVFGVGFPLLFRSIRAKSGVAIVGQIRRETLTLSAFALFYLNLESFPLWVELITQPLVVLASGMLVISQRNENGRSLVGCLTFALAAFAISLGIWTTMQTVQNWGHIDGHEVWLQLLLSVWLPFAMFPFLYGVAFYAGTEVILRRLTWMNGDMPLSARMGVVVGLHFSVRWAKALNGRYNHVGRAQTFRDALSAMREFRDDVAHREEREAQRLEDLAGFAGEPGADGTGAQLDRREFDGTKGALRWIHTAQALRFERLGERFWDDLTDLVIDPPSKWGLPTEHGIVVETTVDKKKWRGWRRLPSGWVLGIGGTGRFGEFLYSAAEPPSSWPGRSDDWIDSSRSLGPIDWERNDGSRL